MARNMSSTTLNAPDRLNSKVARGFTLPDIKAVYRLWPPTSMQSTR